MDAPVPFGPGEPEVTQIDLTAVDATAQAEMVRSRVCSARQLVEATLQRIEHLEPTVNAFRVVTRDQALVDAEWIDSLPDVEVAALPLAGLPVAIKDDTDLCGQSTMWGSAADRGACENDAEVVRRLRRAGATIIGKPNVPELTLSAPTPAARRSSRAPTSAMLLDPPTLSRILGPRGGPTPQR